MNQLKYIYILILLFIFSVAGLSSSGSGQEARASRIIEKFMKTHKMPGLSITVGKEGEIIWSEGFGFADVDKNISVTPQTRFRIGSVSKTVTSAAIGRLIDQDKLDLNVPIQQYVASFPEKRWPITTRQTMGHLAGIRHYRGKEMLSNTFYPNIASGLSIFDQDTLLHEPGTKFRYSSYGWNLVSAVVEGASGIDFLAYMEDTVFTALGMETLMAEHRDSTLTPLASFYSVNNGEISIAPFVDNSYKWAGGGFVGTTIDMVNFIHGLNQTNFLTKKTLNELQKPLRLKNGKSTKYGLGWVTQKDFWRNKIVGHSGGSTGGRAMLIHYPEKDVTVAILINSDSGGNLNKLAKRISNRFMN